MASESQDLPQLDVLVVGGGINGAGIARDAAGRGLKVALCESDDLAVHTSSKSTKLIHGGLRYLEHFEFRLVRESLSERETLLKAAPHIVWPLRFVLPHDPGLRPRWMIRAGLWLYDSLGARRRLEASRSVDLRQHQLGLVLQDRLRHGFVYSDCWVQDARLVVLTVMDAKQRGAEILTRTELVKAEMEQGRWRVTLRGCRGETVTRRTRTIVNAAGPWVGSLLKGSLDTHSDKRLQLVAGSHIVVPKIHHHDEAFIFQNTDGRIVFAIPYERHFSLIGTTERQYSGDPGDVDVTEAEVQYLCECVSRYLRTPVSAGEVVWSFSGVRALFDGGVTDTSSVSRDYVLETGDWQSRPVISVFGGKLTTYRKLAEAAVDLLCEGLSHAAGAWTGNAVLPGGDLPYGSLKDFIKQLSGMRPDLSEQLVDRLARTYGTRVFEFLSDTAGGDELGEEVVPGLFEAEIDYACTSEWVRTGDDMLWRRTKLGLHLSVEQRRRVDAAVASMTTIGVLA